MTGSNQAADTEVDANYLQFNKLVRKAKECHLKGQLEAAAVYAQIAADFAWLNPSGLFASSELECLLLVIGRSLPIVRGRGQRLADPKSVMHVLTQAYQTGGPTQFVACWIDQDLERHQKVCLTRQSAGAVPDKITSRLKAPSDLIRLDSHRRGLLDRAGELRRLAAACDVIVLHTHPYDVVPVLAFTEQNRLPPIIYVNHADHVFWLGVSVAETVMSMRSSGAALAVARRGVELDRSTVMSRPLRPTARNTSRSTAKANLGIPDDEILIVTAADGAKYRAVQEPSLLAMILPVLARHPRTTLLAAGPVAQGEWASAERTFPGRVRALGRLPDVSQLQQAADIYLDSFPFSSLTSLLEAGSYGTPVVTFRGHPDSCSVLGADTHGLDELMLRPSKPEELWSVLNSLIEDERLRSSIGDSTRRAILASHADDGWRKGVRGLYSFAAAARPDPQPSPPHRQVDRLDVLVNLVQQQTPYSAGSSGAILDNLPLLPVWFRVNAAYRLARSGTWPRPRDLLPEWSLPKIAALYRRLRSRLQPKRSSTP